MHPFAALFKLESCETRIWKGSTAVDIKRGFGAGLVGAALGGAVPWLFMCLVLSVKWLATSAGWDARYEINSLSGRAWLGSYFFASLTGSAAFASFAFRPRIPLRHAFAVVAAVAATVLVVVGTISGPRYKSEPPFGEKPGDVALLAVPAAAGGVLLLAWPGLRRVGQPADDPASAGEGKEQERAAVAEGRSGHGGVGSAREE